MFVVLLVLICVKTCCQRNKSLLKINKTIKIQRAGKKRAKKNSIPKEFTNIKAETSPEAFNDNVTNETRLKTSVNNAEITQIAEFQKIAKQEPINPPPAVENEFQILRKQLLSNIKNNNDNYENIMNNNDFKRNNKYKY